MKRETRANVLFLALFLAVSLPGAVILFKKKLDPDASRMGMPEFVRRRLPYMAPLPTPDSEVIRVIPPRTGAWVAELNRNEGGGLPVLMNGRVPVTSSDRIVQVTGLTDGPAATRVFLLIWEGGYGVDASQYRVVARSGGDSFPGRVIVARAIPMPTQVKRELMSGGYVKPSPEVVWLDVTFDAPLSAKRPLALELAYDGGEERPSTTVRVFGE